jgi:hypothetical protein
MELDLHDFSTMCPACGENVSAGNRKLLSTEEKTSILPLVKSFLLKTVDVSYHDSIDNHLMNCIFCIKCFRAYNSHVSFQFISQCDVNFA